MKIIGRIKKTGNSLGFIIPSEYIKMLNLEINDIVEIDLHKKRSIK